MWRLEFWRGKRGKGMDDFLHLFDGEGETSEGGDAWWVVSGWM